MTNLFIIAAGAVIGYVVGNTFNEKKTDKSDSEPNNNPPKPDKKTTKVKKTVVEDEEDKNENDGT